MTFVPVADVAALLTEHHYLGAARRGIAWRDAFGVMVVASPTARHIPKNWLELTRWCIVSAEPNAGSQQWKALRRALRERFPEATTLVSYSDPAAGHTGALYRACNWWWAPTWHRLRPPPSGNGSWVLGERQHVKDRWVFALGKDAERAAVLLARDESVLRERPWARYREPGGASYATFRLLS